VVGALFRSWRLIQSQNAFLSRGPPGT